MYTSFDISKKILELAERDGKKISPMKLLKLVYISHGYHLGFTGNPLIGDSIQAWKHGPVIPELYHAIKRFGPSPVDPELIDLYAEQKVDDKTSGLVEKIWAAYGEMPATKLSAITHNEGTPWSKTWDGEYYKSIDDRTIEKYYKELIEKAKRRKTEKEAATNGN
jgi:uncharacterized phage-associated protein